MKQLALLRHASATGGVPDAQRPLDTRGREEARRIAASLVSLAPRPEVALCSPARRARETFEILRQAFDPEPQLRTEEELYLASTDRLRAVLRRLAPALSRALLVGHNPGLEELARELGRDGRRELRDALERGLPPAGLVILELEAEDWSELEIARGRLVAFETP
jgi:phosphohistidine phosphatase